MSLRLRLLLSVFALTTAVWATAAYIGYRDTRAEIDRLFDAHLVESAAAIMAQAEHERRELPGGDAAEDGDDGDEHDEREEREEHDDEHDERDGEGATLTRGALLEKRLVFRVWDAKGRLLVSAGHAKDFPRTDSGFAEADAGDRPLRVFSRWNADRSLNVEVAESLAAREAIASRAVRGVLTPMGAMLVPLIALLALIIGWAVRPVSRLARSIDRRSPEDLSPLALGELPRELQSPLAALNRLFERLGTARERERRFTDDAAHELRTPLAAIKVQAQVAIREADEARRREALEGVARGVDRAARLVEQLLTLARLGPEQAFPLSEVDMSGVVGGVLRRLAPDALAQSVELELEAEPLCVKGSEPLLDILTRNLVENAIRHAPSGGRVVCRVEHGGEGVQLVVSDTGKGLSSDEIAQLGRPFARLARPSGEGSGLGLSIVKRIAEIHAAALSFAQTSEGGGLTVRVSFPPR